MSDNMNKKNKIIPPADATTSGGQPTQSQRRVLYGFNIFVLILAALAIVVFVNYIGNKFNHRSDFTATRQYSLSEQTTNLIGDLKTPVKITSLYGTASEEYTRQVTDLLEEYDHHSAQITFQEINPTRDIVDYDLFTQSILESYAEEIAAFEKAYQASTKALNDIINFSSKQAQLLKEKRESLGELDEKTQALVHQLQNIVFQQIAVQYQNQLEEIEAMKKQVAPNYDTILEIFRGAISQFQNNILKRAALSFEISVEDAKLNAEAKELFLSLRKEYNAFAIELDATLETLQQVDVSEYTEVRSKINQQNSIVVQAMPSDSAEKPDKNMIVIPSDQVFAIDRQQPSAENEKPKVLFKGEEVVTGAILNVTTKNKPKVVFLQALPQSPLNTGNEGYSEIADRLRAMNFEVEEWNPAGRPGPGGRMMPAGPKPTAKPGQTMVFVVLYSPPFQQGMPVNPGDMQIKKALEEHLASGQPGMLFVAPSPMARFGQEDTSLTFLKDWGITPENGRPVLTAVTTEDGQLRPIPKINILSFPDELSISKAITGLKGAHYSATALTLANPAPEGVKLYPIIKTPEASWAETDVTNNTPTKDENDVSGPLVTGVAAEKNSTRLVVISDPVWAINGAVRFSQAFNASTGRMIPDNPANAELTTNAIFWLSDFEQLIAASPRTQDTRRVEAWTYNQGVMIWWFVLAIIPLGCLVAGGVVWFMRRK